MRFKRIIRNLCFVCEEKKGRKGIFEHDLSYLVILCITQESSGNTLYDNLLGYYLP